MIQKLKNELLEAAKAYYQEDVEIMSDQDYDLKLEYLKSLVTEEDIESDDELRNLLYDSPSAGTTPSGKTIKHAIPMLSLGKANTYEELKRYHEKLISAGAGGFKLQAKFDGIAMSAIYMNGVLQRLVTRGDGVEGEVITHIVNSNELTVLNLPKRINTTNKIEVRGEVFATGAQFKVINKNRKEAVSEEFSNSRNAVSGILKKSAGILGYKAELTFVSYSLFIDDKPRNLSDIVELDDFLSANECTARELSFGDDFDRLKCGKNFNDLEKIVRQFGEARKNMDIPTDGVVIKPMNEAELLVKMGSTSHHPVAFIAFKYPGATGTTVVEDITLSVGKTGRITPRAKVKPVTIDGVTITNISCHNFNWLHEMGIRVGSTVTVTRANDVIPAILSVVASGDGELMSVPHVCPECGSELEHDGQDWPPKTLNCVNEKCPSRILFYMKSIVGRQYLDIDGLSDAGLESLCNDKLLKDIVDLFNLTVTVLEDVEMSSNANGTAIKIGTIRATKIYNAIQNAKLNTPSFKLLASVGIKGVGPSTAKALITHFDGLENALSATRSELSKVTGFGEVNLNAFISEQPRALELVRRLKSIGVRINDVGLSVKSDKSFSVSGSVEGFANRDEFVAYMESQGWEFHKSPKANTTVLFADPSGTSSKIKKAQANGTKIINNLSEL